jgi:DNA-binding GntR family transcriptional regulator
MAILEAKPKYKQMKDILLERIYSGEYQPESKFPTENELVNEFGVSKHTVLKTLGELVNEDFLYRRQGSGTFVKNFMKKSRQRKASTVAFLYYGDTKLNMPMPSLQLFSSFEKAFRNNGRFEVNLV